MKNKVDTAFSKTVKLREDTHWRADNLRLKLHRKNIQNLVDEALNLGLDILEKNIIHS